jgi:hypothetical protein
VPFQVLDKCIHANLVWISCSLLLVE